MTGFAQWDEPAGLVPPGRLPRRVYLALDPTSGHLVATDAPGPILFRETDRGTLSPSDNTDRPAARTRWVPGPRLQTH